jgi:putative ABC transport system permease protein
VTEVLRLLAVIVAMIGILSALMAVQLERAAEFGLLRALGFTPGQVYGMVVAQTGATGLIAGLLAVPTGIGLAMMLIEVINLRSFGWTLHTVVPLQTLAGGLAAAVIAALLAGLYPAWKMSRTPPAAALRDE